MTRATLVATVVGGILPGSVLVAIAAAGLLLGGSAPAAAFRLDGLPEATVHNYHFAEQHPLLLRQIPCYCGCDSLAHRNLLDCFVRPTGGYEEHGSGCAICGREVDDAERLLLQGADARTIRTAIDADYARYGRGTNTP